MIELFPIGYIVRKFGVGWSIGFTSGRDKFPTATYRCPFCDQVVPHVAQHQGFCGIPPKAGCNCKDPVPYPVNDEAFAQHLLKKPIWNDSNFTPTKFIDTWDERQ